MRVCVFLGHFLTLPFSHPIESKLLLSRRSFYDLIIFVPLV